MNLFGTARFFSITAGCFLLPHALAAQSSAADSLFYKNAVSNLVARYHEFSGDQSGLLNGSQYGNYAFPFAEGQPFFASDKPGTGSVVYDGILYENVPLQFDEVQQVLLAEANGRRIQLLSERIARFTLFTHRFIRLVKDSQSAMLPATGFYDVLYEGKNSLLKKEEKVIREDVGTGVLLRFIDIHQLYYLKRNDGYVSIRNKGAFLSVFKDRKKELKQFIRKNKLSYRKDRDNMLAAATAYYDQLTR